MCYQQTDNNLRLLRFIVLAEALNFKLIRFERLEVQRGYIVKNIVKLFLELLCGYTVCALLNISFVDD